MPRKPADDREPYGRIVHEQRLAYRAERERRTPLLWEKRDPRLRELDMRIASAVAARAVHDARLDADRMRVRLFALGAHMPAILDALRLAAADTEFGARAKRFGAALAALGGSEEGTHDG